MKKLFNYSDEAQALIKSKIETEGIKMSYEIVWGLLNELELEIEKIRLTEGWHEKLIEINGANYLILTEEEANEEAYNMIVELGVENLKLDLTHFLNENWISEALFEVIEATVDMMPDEEVEEKLKAYGLVEMKENNREILTSEIFEDFESKREMVEELIEIFGKDEVISSAIETGGLNLQEVVDEVIYWDGRGHVISDCDGVEIEINLDENKKVFAYRVY